VAGDKVGAEPDAGILMEKFAESLPQISQGHFMVARIHPSETFAEREEASRQLETILPPAIEAVKKAHNSTKDPDVDYVVDLHRLRRKSVSPCEKNKKTQPLCLVATFIY
jgi:hypothetical protein